MLLFHGKTLEIFPHPRTVPLPRVHLVRYAGCLAPHSQLRGAIIPTPRQQGVDEDDTDTGTPRWS